jgi:hypothetical protein
MRCPFEQMAEDSARDWDVTLEVLMQIKEKQWWVNNPKDIHLTKHAQQVIRTNRLRIMERIASHGIPGIREYSPYEVSIRTDG